PGGLTMTGATRRIIAAAVLAAAGFIVLSRPALAAHTRRAKDLGAQRNAAAAQRRAGKAWVAARTPNGHPDFQGVWANNTVTPLQRPKQWEGKTHLTDAEVAELQKF